MGRMAAPELRLSIDALKSQIGPVSTSAEAECWWPLALRIDDTIELGDPASHRLLWAVSDVIRALKRSGTPDLDRVRQAVTEIEGRLTPTPGAAAQ